MWCAPPAWIHAATAFIAFEELSPTYLKHVYEKLNGELDYDDLKILRLLYLISRQG